MVVTSLKVNNNLKLKVKKSNYNIFYEFQTSFINANLKWKSFFYCRHSIILEKILSILWDQQCINGFLKYRVGQSYILQILFKRDLKGYSAINQIVFYSSLHFFSWLELKKILMRNLGILYIVTTSLGIFDGQLALKKGLGGFILCKLVL